MTASDAPAGNPFEAGTAGSCRFRLAWLIHAQPHVAANDIFRDRAVALVEAAVPLLVWLRDHRGRQLTAEFLRFAFDLPWLAALADEHVLLARDPATGIIARQAAGDVPAKLIEPVRCYLRELPGYDDRLVCTEQTSGEPLRQHGYARWYLENSLLWPPSNPVSVVASVAPPSKARRSNPVLAAVMRRWAGVLDWIDRRVARGPAGAP